MASLLGIDIGTSGTKVMLLDEKTGVAGIESETYQVSIPRRDMQSRIRMCGGRPCFAAFRA